MSGNIQSVFTALNVQPGEVLIFEGKETRLGQPSFGSTTSVTTSVPFSAVYKGMQDGKIIALRNGKETEISVASIKSIIKVQGEETLGASTKGRQKLLELKQSIQLDPKTSFPVNFDLARDFPYDIIRSAIYVDKSTFLESVDFFEDEIRKTFTKPIMDGISSDFRNVDEALEMIRNIGFEKFKLKNNQLSEKESSARAIFTYGISNNGDKEILYARELLARGIPREIKDTMMDKIIDDIWRTQVGTAASTPPYVTLHYLRDAKQESLLHFTFSENAGSISDEGFKYGITQISGIQQTRGFGCAKEITGETGGYGFACIPGEKMLYPQRNNPSSGAVVIKTDAVIAFHKDDLEKQAIFWGPDVTPENIGPPMYQTKVNGKYYWNIDTLNGEGYTISESSSFEEATNLAVKWVEDHWSDFLELRKLNGGKLGYNGDLTKEARSVAREFSGKLVEKWSKE